MNDAKAKNQLRVYLSRIPSTSRINRQDAYDSLPAYLAEVLWEWRRAHLDDEVRDEAVGRAVKAARLERLPEDKPLWSLDVTLDSGALLMDVSSQWSSLWGVDPAEIVCGGNYPASEGDYPSIPHIPVWAESLELSPLQRKFVEAVVYDGASTSNEIATHLYPEPKFHDEKRLGYLYVRRIAMELRNKIAATTTENGVTP